MKRFIKRKLTTKSDEAASNSVAFIGIMGFIMVLMISFIDMGVYFHTKNQLHDAAQAGARATAMYGGANTTLVSKYGGGVKPQTVAYNAIPSPLKNKGLIINPVRVGDVTCTNRAAAGRPVNCAIKYEYKGLLGNANLFKKKSSGSGSATSENVISNKGESATRGSQEVRAYAVSEVTAK